jgi:hypothetical protein
LPDPVKLIGQIMETSQRQIVRDLHRLEREGIIASEPTKGEEAPRYVVALAAVDFEGVWLPTAKC